MAALKCRGFSANLAMLFTDGCRFLDRFRRARQAGFDAVEISTNELFDYKASEVASILKGEGLQCVLFNMPAGDWRAGDRGLAALPNRRDDFQRSIEVALEYAEKLSCPRVHCLAGIAPVDAAATECYTANLRTAVEALSVSNVDVLIEPINHRSIPGYYLCSLPQANDILGSIPGHPGSARLLFDVFHCQILHGDILENLRRYRHLIGHIQIAGVPHRMEPDNQQEVNYPFLMKALREDIGYTGHIGCEYNPRGRTEDGLGWLNDCMT